MDEIFVEIQIPAKGVAGWDHTVIRTPGRCQKAQVSVIKALNFFLEKNRNTNKNTGHRHQGHKVVQREPRAMD